MRPTPWVSSASPSSCSAIAAQPRTSCRTPSVYDLATGRQHTWYAPTDETSGASLGLQTPSWEANGRYLAINVSSPGPHGGNCLNCIRLLDTSTAGGAILSHSRLLVRSPDLHAFVLWDSALITPDGSRVLRPAVDTVPATRIRSWISEFSATSGILIRSVPITPASNWTLLWSSADGRSFIASSPHARQGGITVIVAARYADGRWHPVPLSAKTVAVAW